jgi:bacterial/archaeal transporter family protein
MGNQRWLVYALLSAACAALVGIFGRAGLKDVEPNLATAVRSIVMTVLLLGFVTVTRGWARLPPVTSKPGLLILLSGAAGAASWLFYFNALKLADVSRVAPIDKLSTPIAVVLAALLLGERPTGLNWLGVVVMVAGAYLVAHRPAA